MLQEGTNIGSYEILGLVAAGGMGVVHRARHRLLGKEVAIKELASNLVASDKVQARFQQEAYVQSQLEHQNIVRVTDFVIEGGTFAIVMDFVEGPSLESVLQDERPGPWPLSDIMKVMEPVIEAVAHAHELGVVHRDLKPANVLLDRKRNAGWPGIPKITDFGLAKILSSDAAMTRTGARMGTLPYMAPEQFEGRKEIDSRADVFALAMMFLRLFEGQLPIDPDNMMQVMELYSGARPVFSQADRLLCGSLRVTSVLTQALALKLKDRTADAAQLQRLLSEAVVADMPPPPPHHAHEGKAPRPEASTSEERANERDGPSSPTEPPRNSHAAETAERGTQGQEHLSSVQSVNGASVSSVLGTVPVKAGECHKLSARETRELYETCLFTRLQDALDADELFRSTHLLREAEERVGHDDPRLDTWRKRLKLRVATREERSVEHQLGLATTLLDRGLLRPVRHILAKVQAGGFADEERVEQVKSRVSELAKERKSRVVRMLVVVALVVVATVIVAAVLGLRS